ncbi:hypothetical protein [Bartonella massiliensis]|nr:hypothetical protein [Bartonella massiliensis]
MDTESRDGGDRLVVKGAYRAGWCRLSMAMEIGRRSDADRGGRCG